MEPNKWPHGFQVTQWGILLAMAKLRGDSSWQTCHRIRFPHACRRAQRRTQIRWQAEVPGAQPSERNRKEQDVHFQREASFRDVSNPWQAFRGAVFLKYRRKIRNHTDA